MRMQTVALALGLFIAGCESKKAGPEASTNKSSAAAATTKRPQAPLVDLTATTKLDAMRTAFNAHKGEARFLTLLSPT